MSEEGPRDETSDENVHARHDATSRGGARGRRARQGTWDGGEGGG